MGIGAILKGIGRTTMKTVTNIDKAAGKMGIDDAAKATADAAIGPNSKLGAAGRKIFEKTPGVADGEKSTEDLIHRIAGFKMKKGAQYAVGGALATVGILAVPMKANSGRDIGKIDAGRMANTIGEESSPGLDATVDRLDEDEKYRKEFMTHNLPIDAYGSEGDLVFALHDLRGPK